MAVAVHTKGAHGDSEIISGRKHVGQGGIGVGDRIDVKSHRPGNMRRGEFRLRITIYSRQMVIRIEQQDIVEIVAKPVCSHKR